MSIHNLRKALGLLIVDIVIIIGIFVLQFRTDSSIIEKLGNLQITMEKMEENDNSPTELLALNNKLRINYNGINIFTDDQNPIKVESTNNITETRLTNYTKISDLAYQFAFTNNITLRVILSSLDNNATLSVYTEFPPNIKTIYIPYSYSYNMKIKKEEQTSIIFEEKKSAWELQGLSFADGYIAFTHGTNMISYSTYTDVQKFTFDSITELAIANQAQYEASCNAIKNNLINTFATTSENNMSEQTVVSYIAAMAEQGNYGKAIDNIPQSIKQSPDRTYISAPYLNNLSNMNEKLDSTLWTNEKLISDSAANGKLNILGIRNLAMFLCIHPKTNEVQTLLNNAANLNIETSSLAQAVGIIQLYNDLVPLNSAYASILEPVLMPCVDQIASMCALNSNVLTISENDTFLSVVQAVEVGVTLLRYGIISKNPVIEKAGYAIVNSYISESSSFDIRTLSNLYPIIAYNNIYYPHFLKLQIDSKNTMWAWTCAKNITLNRTSEEITYNIDFPEGLTHYIIVKGVPKFHSIYIYKMAFRTDPRFETYNSSGYVYKRESKTLLLKSRQKSKIEEIRLELGDAPAAETSTASKSAPKPPVKADTPSAESESAATENRQE